MGPPFNPFGHLVRELLGQRRRTSDVGALRDSLVARRKFPALPFDAAAATPASHCEIEQDRQVVAYSIWVWRMIRPPPPSFTL
ncbi:hypothetical protein [Bradyrhizobium sp. BR 10289]|uniref:hypothetical protein n=1 Tax=Bradyrhizobium sp. BR 10289 TaxID=2749993 RepID=UPI001C651A26|nr:hypothetical protein [Bradyrhizobium sp. BR 10289]MBW7972489.1 hypothetical protein [Bradyrhizobium sp. BR 10289]